MATDKELPSSGETPDIDVWVGEDGFIRRKQKQTQATPVVMSRQEKQRSKLINLRWAAGEAAKADIEITKIPSYSRLPDRDTLLKAKYGPKAGQAGEELLAQHTKLVADFVTDVKADPELILVWIDAEYKIATEAQATDLMVEFGLGGDEYKKFRDSAVAVSEAVAVYNRVTSIEGTTVAPKLILESRIARDKAILAACLNCQHLIVLHMDYGMLPAKYTRRADFAQVRHSSKLVKEKKDALLKAYRQSAMDEYKMLEKNRSDVAFSYELWNKEYLDTL